LNKSQKNYPEEFKKSSVQLAVDSDKPISHTARDLGINKTTLYSWVAKYFPNHKNKVSDKDSEAMEELKRLRKENHRLKQERDILKKAAAYFASEAQ
jgi:transposase